MSARRFDYFDDAWKTEILECPKCNWLGTFEQGSVEYYDQLMDSSCPRCPSLDAPMLAIVSYPTLEELRANQDKPGIREYVQKIDDGLDKFAREKLQVPEQLPEIDENSFALEWDKELPIPVPPLSLQQKFAGIVHRVNHLHAAQREALRQAEHLFTSLLDRAFGN